MKEKFITTETQELIKGKQAERFARIMEQRKAAKTTELKSSSEYQRQEKLGKHGRAKEAIEFLAKDMMRITAENGKEITWDQAQRYMANMAEQADRKSGK